jgi:EAL and modified HD-GYP domain-containing signal transduction protein
MQDHAFIGRQPILDAQQKIVAYELLFRHSASAKVAIIEDDLKDCARVLVNTMSDMGALNCCRRSARCWKCWKPSAPAKK